MTDFRAKAEELARTIAKECGADFLPTRCVDLAEASLRAAATPPKRSVQDCVFCKRRKGSPVTEGCEMCREETPTPDPSPTGEEE